MTEFGIVLGGFGQGVFPAPRMVEFARQVEEWGFDSLWYRDHLLWHSPVFEPLTMLGAFAAVTQRVKLGTSVILLPIRNAARVAQAIATLDHLTNGRAILGVGLGGEFTPEYAVSGVDRKERGGRANEALEVIHRLWTEDNVTFHGKYFAFERATLAPKPIQVDTGGRPPIWVGGRAEGALRRAGRYADSYFAYFMTPRQFGESLTKVKDYAALAGRPADAVFGSIVFYYHLATTREAAKEQAVAYLNAEYRMSFDELADRFVALGSPADCAELIAQFQAAGSRHFVLAPACSVKAIPDQVQRFLEEVRPLVPVP